jgi:Zn-dependent oligopeptidase
MARATTHKWSQQVTDHSNALDLKEGVFKLEDPRRIAASLKDSADHSERRHGDPYRSAMSMLTFYINRAGAQLQPEDKSKLEKAKEELRQLYHKPESGKTTPLGRKVEKPGSGKQGGPSGQRDGAKHDGKHANK